MIIGLSGRKGVGKNTVGDYLVARYGFVALSFAAKLKESAAAALGIDPAVFETAKNDPLARVFIRYSDKNGRRYENGLSIRQYLQRYGTEAHRDIFGASFWRDVLFAEMGTDEDYVVTDVRFNDEHRALRDRGATIWRIDRDIGEGLDTHSSEMEPDSALIDVCLDNNGTVDELYRSVNEALLCAAGFAYVCKDDRCRRA